jgi:hypothetical protein
MVVRRRSDLVVCRVEVRGFEPLASSVRETIRVIGRPGRTLGNACRPARSADRRSPLLSVAFRWSAAPPRPRWERGETQPQPIAPADQNPCWTAASSSPRPPCASPSEDASPIVGHGRPGGRPGQPSATRARARAGKAVGVDGWLADDAQPRQDVPADRAPPVPPAGGHPIVPALGSDPKESAGRRRIVLGRRVVGWGAIVAGSGGP